jgi:DNA-binding transcriptional regulator LsrR (DeoR family)
VDVTSTLAARFGAQVTHLHSPAFAANPDVAQALLSSSEIAATLEEARTAGAVLVSVGVVGSGSLLLTEGFLSHADMRGLVARGAVGEILGHYYDRDGRHVPTGALLPIGLTLDQLRENGHVVAVAAGVEKVEAVRAALAGGLVDKLAVDDAHAVTLLRQP